MRLSTPVTALAAGVFALGLAVPAQAAPGRVTIQDRATGQVWEVANPGPGCHSLRAELDAKVTNNTRGVIQLFPDSGCRSKVNWPVNPGESRQARVGSFRALN